MRLQIALTAMAVLGTTTIRADGPADRDLAKQLRALDARVIVLGDVRRPPLASMLADDAETKLRVANRADRLAWADVKTRADWERFRDARLTALRKSLGALPPIPKDLKVRVTGTLNGDGYRVQNLVYETRPGLLATANLYQPVHLKPSMTGMILCHSHQSAKHTGWRQDMAMTWARAGCVVLVPDHLGHGERRQHPFGDDAPHDYHHRYDLGCQLHLVGDSLMGWLVWDLMRGVDVLLAQKGVDSKRIVMISEPAGGGDVAAVTAALDSRISAVMVQNFGGPQPETTYPLPRDAEESFNYTGRGSWESTRNLRLSARDGFLPWTIVASIAPRKLIYFHEFYWDREQDPVWKRLQRVNDFYDAKDSLVGLAGKGFVVGSAPENTHWLPINRELLYPTLERWFAIPDPKKEYSKRLPVRDLLSLTPDVSTNAQPVHALLRQMAQNRIGAARNERFKLTPAQYRDRLREDWTRLLGDVAPCQPTIKGLPIETQTLGKMRVERIQLGTEPGTVVPVLLLTPPRAEGKRGPIVIGNAQQGKHAFLQHNAEAIAELLTAGVAVCLPDLRGIGETSPGETRDRRSAVTQISATEWMLGQSLLGGRLRDLRSLLLYLRQRPDVDDMRIGLWGDSFAKLNPPSAKFNVPHTVAERPSPCEPLGGTLALLGALFEPGIRAVYVRRGLSDYQSVLDERFCYVPHDMIVPGLLAGGDMADLAGAIAPAALWLDGMTDGLNRLLSDDDVARRFTVAKAGYARAKAVDRLRLQSNTKGDPAPARWLLSHLKVP